MVTPAHENDKPASDGGGEGRWPVDLGSIDRFAAGAGDAVGLLGYALHLRACREWQIAFAAAHQRRPEAGETAGFLVGETMPGRIAFYRAEAERLIARPVPVSSPKTSVPGFWWGASLQEAVAAAGKPLRWRDLMLRLVLLTGGVVATAILLRLFVVPKL